MPLGDGTGPRGQGPRTGRGLGTCVPRKSKKRIKRKGRAIDSGYGYGGRQNVEVQ